MKLVVAVLGGLLIAGCQSDSTRMEGSRGNTQVSISVNSPSPAAPAESPTPVEVSTPKEEQQPPPGEGVVQVTPPTPLASVRVEADGNKVVVDQDGVKVTSSQGAQVSVDPKGISLKAGGARQDGDKLVIEGVGDKQTYKVNNQDVVVNGTGHAITLSGSVGELEVNGTGNQVDVEKVQEVELNGTGNKVIYQGARPEVQLNGLGNSCDPK